MDTLEGMGLEPAMALMLGDIYLGINKPGLTLASLSSTLPAEILLTGPSSPQPEN